MKYLFLLLVLTGCATYKDGYKDALIEFNNCTNDQIFLYGDICAEARDDDGDPVENHYAGVVCAIEATRACMGFRR